MERLKRLGKILRNLPESLNRPEKVFNSLGKGFPFLLILLLFPVRMLHTQLHILLVHPGTYFAQYSNLLELFADFVLIRGFEYIYYFLLVSTVIYIIGKRLKNNMKYEGIEEGVFYIMVAPVLLMFLDLPHLFIEPTFVWRTCFHISLLAILVVMPVQISCLIEKAWGIPKKFTVLPALLIPLRFKWLPVFLAGSGIPAPWLPMQIFFLFSAVFLAFFYAKEREWKRAGLVLLLFAYGLWMFLF